MNEWRTGDTALAAYLVHEEHECQRMEWEADSCYFVFDDTSGLQDCILEFVGDEASVNPRTYSRTLTTLRRQMFDARDAAKTRAAS